MTLVELIVELEATGMNQNTIQLCINCYLMGMVNERNALIDIAEGHLCGDHRGMINDMRARDKIGYTHVH
jgi:hypothetical protein